MSNNGSGTSGMNLVVLAFGGCVYSCAVFVDGLQTWRFLIVCLAGGRLSCQGSCWALAVFILSQTGVVN